MCHSVKIHLSLSEDLEDAVSDVFGVGVTLSARLETTLFDWIPFECRLSEARLRGTSKVSNRHHSKRNYLVVSVDCPKDCSPNAVSDTL